MRRQASAVAAVLGAVVLLTPGLAQANWSAAGTGNASVTAATLRNARVLAVGCGSNKNSPLSVSWNPSLDSFVSSYTVERTVTNAGVTVSVTTFPGVTSPWPDVGAGASNKDDIYSYRIRAECNLWRTPYSAAVSRSYPSPSGACV